MPHFGVNVRSKVTRLLGTQCHSGIHFIFHLTDMALASLASRLRPPTLMRIVRKCIAIRKVITDEDNDLDLLLNLGEPLGEQDLPQDHPYFFEAVTIESFRKEFGWRVLKVLKKENMQEAKDAFAIRKLAVVLPLQFSGVHVIPIPFIVATGAPHPIYLCSSAVRLLNGCRVLKVTDGLYPYQMIGKLLGPEGKEFNNPPVSVLPSQYEKFQPHNPRMNLIGIELIHYFKLLTL